MTARTLLIRRRAMRENGATNNTTSATDMVTAEGNIPASYASSVPPQMTAAAPTGVHHAWPSITATSDTMQETLEAERLDYSYNLQIKNLFLSRYGAL